MKKLLAYLLWATCLPNLTYAQINPKDLVGVWLIDSLDNRKNNTKGYFILYDNDFAERTPTINLYASVSKWYFENDTLVFKEGERKEDLSIFKVLKLDNHYIILDNYGRKAVFKKITQEELNALKNAPERKIELDEREKRWKEEQEREKQERKERLLPYCGTWKCKVGKNNIVLQLKEDGDLIYQAGKVQATGGWEYDMGMLDISFPMQNNEFEAGRQNYRLQIISQTDKELKTKDFLTQTVLVWRR